MARKDECWKYTEDFPGRTKFQTKCMFCKEINTSSIYRFKYHIAAIPRHDITICTQQTAEAKRTCLVALEKYDQEKLNKRRQPEGLRAIGSHAPVAPSASTSIGCVGEGSFKPPFCPSSSARASASRSYTKIEFSLMQPKVRKNRLDSYFVARTTSGSQPSLESMGSLNKEINDATRKQICEFWYFCNIPFIAAR